MTAPAVLAVVAAFALGSVLGAQLLGRLRGVDLRASGSGNLGATNALRTGGRAFGLAVLAIDVLKAVIGTTVLPWLDPGNAQLPWICGAALVAGHVFSPFAGFHGGKGAAALIGVYATLLPAALLLAVPVFALVLMLSGYVSLSILVGSLVVVLHVACVGSAGLWSPAGAFAAAMFAFLLWTHRENLVRLAGGVERRFDKVMLLRRRG